MKIGLDYSQLFLDPIMAESVLIHETVHEYLAIHSNYGQATSLLCSWLPKVKHLNEDQKKRIISELRNSQLITQETSATFMAYQHVKVNNGKQYADVWRDKLGDDYKQYLNNIVQIIHWSQKYRDMFTKNIPLLAMDTNIMIDIEKNDLVNNPDAFYEYLRLNEHRPDWRFMRLIEFFKENMWVLTKSKEILCDRCEISCIPPVTKVETVDFMNYLAGMTNEKKRYSVEQIRGKPSINALFSNATIANINLNLKENAECLWNIKDLLHYKDVIEAVFVNPLENDDIKRDLDLLVGKDHRISLLAFTRFGEKYIIGLTEAEAVSLINNELKEASLIVKWGAYKIERNNLVWLSAARPPDIIIYNNIEDTNALIDTINKNAEFSIKYIHIGASQGHPFGTLFFKINELSVLHGINTYGNNKTQEYLEAIGKQAVPSVLEEVVSEKSYNNYFSVWCGLPWEINWYKSTIDGVNICYR
ncbi:MAG: hypothetical protein WC500_06810 [Candidatus Margulisiibacteriota bacterium]